MMVALQEASLKDWFGQAGMLSGVGLACGAFLNLSVGNETSNLLYYF